MKLLKWSVVTLLVLGITGYFTFEYLMVFTKSKSPEDTVVYTSGDFEMKVNYSRPSMKNRQIFGDLVPFGEVWRMGANEPTTLEFNKKILFDDVEVGAGTYSLWAIPEASQWTIILNSEIPRWGIDFSGKASRNQKYDVALINVPTNTISQAVEQFTIQFEYHVNLVFLWENTRVMVPIIY